ncbi:hypothetical protein ACIBCT_01725 [Streptosporangium sp. NPDC050855]|uniref:hypothetical protein n=1 Tax=Streptosporangium sp. NPDC050855 TaxID=3366194 RepID=UPI0037B7E549
MNRVAKMAAGALTALVLTGGGAAATAATGTAATAEQHAGAEKPGGKLPRNFLLHESQARKPVKHPGEEKWTISDRHERLNLSPCDVGRSTDRGRVSTRTVTYTALEVYQAEQVVIYRSERAARTALADLRRRIGGCEVDQGDQVIAKGRTKKIKVGDQAVRVIVQNYDRRDAGPAIGGQRGVIVRKGRALVSYTQAREYSGVHASDFRRQLKDARKMAVKVCSLPGVC